MGFSSLSFSGEFRYQKPDFEDLTIKEDEKDFVDQIQMCKQNLKATLSYPANLTALPTLDVTNSKQIRKGYSWQSF